MVSALTTTGLISCGKTTELQYAVEVMPEASGGFNASGFAAPLSQAEYNTLTPEEQYQASLAENSKRSDRVLKSAVKKANDEGGDKYDGKQEITVSKGTPDGKVDQATTQDLHLDGGEE